MFAFLDRGVTTFDCADIYTGVEEHDRRLSRRLADRARRGGGARLQGPHQVRARLGHASRRIDPLRRDAESSTARSSGCKPSGSTSSSSTGGTTRCRVRSRPAGHARRAAARRARSTSSAGPTSTRRTAARCSMPASRSCRCRSSIRCSTPGPRTALSALVRRDGDAAPLLRHARRRFPVRALARRDGAAASPHATARSSSTSSSSTISAAGTLFQELLGTVTGHRRAGTVWPSRRRDAVGARPSRRSRA